MLGIACRHEGISQAYRRSLLEDFYTAWKDYALVIDLWFNLQAQSPLINIAGLKALESHPDFDIKNPNRVRSLYAAFGMLNNRKFHAPDGSGYRFLSEAIMKIDALNPQVAARMTTPLTRMGRYDSARQQLMRRELNTHVTERDTVSGSIRNRHQKFELARSQGVKEALAYRDGRAGLFDFAACFCVREKCLSASGSVLGARW